MTGVRKEIEDRITVLDNQIDYYRKEQDKAAAHIADLDKKRHHWRAVLDKIEPETEETDR